MGATGGQSLLGKITYIAAAIFMVTTLTLTVMQGGSGSTGLRDKLKAETSSNAEVAPTEGEVQPVKTEPTTDTSN